MIERDWVFVNGKRVGSSGRDAKIYGKIAIIIR